MLGAAALTRFGNNRAAQPGVTTLEVRWWDLLVVVLLLQVFCGLILLVMAFADPGQSALTLSGILSSIMFQSVMAGVVVMVVSIRCPLEDWFGLRWSGWPHVFWIAPVVVFGMWGFAAILESVGYMKWMEKLGAKPTQESVRLLQEGEDPILLLAMSFAAVVAAPICEEILFRGYVYQVFKKYSGASVSLIASSLFFACAHGSLASFLPLFVLGGLLVVVYERTRSLWAPVAVHFFFNLGTVVVQLALRTFDQSVL